MKGVRLVAIWMVALVLAACPEEGGDQGGTFYPDEGTMYYAGASPTTDEVNFDFTWANPVFDDANYTGDAIYEHDFNVFTGGVYWACDSQSDLPDYYDDCITAGVDEESGVGFGFGSYSADEIEAGFWYFGDIQVYRSEDVGDMVEFDFNVTGARMDNECFGLPTPWCLFTAESKVLISQSEPNLWTGVDDFRSWSF